MTREFAGLEVDLASRYCDTLGIQVFLRFSGELVSFSELGQLDLIKVL